MGQRPPTGQHWLWTQIRQGLTVEQFNRGAEDIVEGIRRYPLWMTIGLHDIKQRYRRSLLGPFWITISMGVMVAALGLLYGKIFNRNLAEYLPYLAAGYILWALLSSIILDGRKSFINAERLIRQLPTPMSVHVYRVLWTNLIILGHNIWILAIVMIWYQVNPGWTALYAIPGIFLILINGVWIALFLGLVSARFRDIPLIVASVVQIMFFITPIIWHPDMLPGRSLFLAYNPFYHLIEIVRAPLLGSPPPLDNWLAALLITALGWILAIFFYTIYRWRISYWV